MDKDNTPELIQLLVFRIEKKVSALLENTKVFVDSINEDMKILKEYHCDVMPPKFKSIEDLLRMESDFYFGQREKKNRKKNDQ